mgnify:CR=1 FL=1
MNRRVKHTIFHCHKNYQMKAVQRGQLASADHIVGCAGTIFTHVVVPWAHMWTGVCAHVNGSVRTCERECAQKSSGKREKPMISILRTLQQTEVSGQRICTLMIASKSVLAAWDPVSTVTQRQRCAAESAAQYIGVYIDAVWSSTVAAQKVIRYM